MVLNSAAHKDNADGVPHFMGLTGRTLSILVSVVATNGFLLFGYDQGVMSGIISARPFNTAFPETLNNSTWQGFVTAIYEVGCLFGAIFALSFGDRLGRRRAIILGGLVMIIGVIIQVSAIPGHSATAQFIIGRTVMGLGNGLNTATIPTYQAECSRTSNRGLLICIEGGVIAFGTLIAYWTDYVASFGPDEFTWRFPITLQVIFGAFLFTMIGLPESPRWLLARGRSDDAATSLAALRGLRRDHPEVQLQLGIIVDSLKISGGAGGESTPFSALFTGGKTQHFRRMLLGASSQMFQQIGGCNAVIYYLPILFESSVGEGRNLALILSGVNITVYAIFATVSWFIIERVGRRKLFIIGTIGQGLSMTLAFACLIKPEVSAKGAVLAFFIYIAFFGATWLPLPWLYPAEVNPIKTRGRANAISTCTNWLFNFLIVMITPVMITNIGWGTYLVYALCNFGFLPFVYFFYPETRKRSLEEIDLIFAKGYLENISYVRASYEMPFLSDEEIEQKAREYGFSGSDDEAGQLGHARFGEKEGDLAQYQAGGGQMA